MGFLSWPLYVQALVVLTVLSVVYLSRYSKLGDLINWNYTSSRTIRKKAAALDCKEPWTRNTRFFGLSDISEQLKATKEHRALERSVNRFKESGAWTHGGTFLGRSIIITVEPTNLQSLLATDFNSYGIEEQRREFVPMLGHGIFSTDGQAWKHSRESLRPSFTRTNISDVKQFEPHIQNLLRRIPSDGSTVDLQPLFFDLAMDVSTEFLFGESTNSLVGEAMPQEVSRFVTAWNDASEAMTGGSGKWGILSIFFEDPSYRKNCKIIHEFVDKLVAKNIAILKSQDSEKRDTFLGGLLESVTSPLKLRSECLNVLVAGKDTTSALLGNLFWIISHRKDIEARLREEIQNLPSPVQYEDLKDLKYLRALINESLRLYPIVPQNAKQAVRDTVLPIGGGSDGKSKVFVPKGTIVAWNLYAMHRRKDIFGEDADEFKPERWLDTETAKGARPGWGYLPFNGGPRICIGQQFAITETSYVVVRLLQEFSSIESRDPDPWMENLSITCSSYNGCKVAVGKV